MSATQPSFLKKKEEKDKEKKIKTEKEEKEKEEKDKRRVCLIGVDEAGRGPLAGPLTTAACWLDEDWEPDDAKEAQVYKKIRDSKKYTTSSEKQMQERADACKLLTSQSQEKEPGVLYSLTFTDVKEINTTCNILQSTFNGWVKDVNSVVSQLKQRFQKEEIKIKVMIDGDKIPEELLQQMNEQFTVVSEIKGDDRFKPIAAASIIAKENRDRYMIDVLHQQYPQYEFDQHKGYGTQAHTEKLHLYGKCPAHRYFKIPKLSAFKSKKRKNKASSSATVDSTKVAKKQKLVECSSDDE